ncbi:hypothetical protein DPMN_113857 [Dreissena polymorpha]|uniref:Uncharacterized protein n=1 Tax=Dreissena polymorpha TaxID=45954 RepID=A0A9D4KJ26_DREPO|nr:hypothetical protein DPMN_113857 [Dreissena polymorpha]
MKFGNVGGFRIVSFRRLGELGSPVYKGSQIGKLITSPAERAGQHLKKGCGTLKNISHEHLGNYVDFKRCFPGCRVTIAS